MHSLFLSFTHTWDLGQAQILLEANWGGWTLIDRFIGWKALDVCLS